MSHVGWGGEQTTIYKSVKTSPSRRAFQGKPERESSKRIISASGGSGRLQMASEPDTERCASLLAIPRRGIDTRQCASKDARPKGGGFGGGPTSIRGRKECHRVCWREGGWIVMSHIGWGGKKTTIYKGVKTFPYQTHFKALRKSPKRQYIMVFILVNARVFILWKFIFV